MPVFLAIPAEELEIPAAGRAQLGRRGSLPGVGQHGQGGEDGVVQQAVGFASCPPALLGDLLSRLGLSHGLQRLLGGGEAPAGQHVLWVYGHVPNGWTGDATAAIERQLDRFAPGFRDLVLARHAAGPADLAAGNANYVGGDIACGSMTGLQSVARPVRRRVPYATPNEGIYLCSSATPPGPGVHGMCGYYAARVSALRSFNIQIKQPLRI